VGVVLLYGGCALIHLKFLSQYEMMSTLETTQIELGCLEDGANSQASSTMLSADSNPSCLLCCVVPCCAMLCRHLCARIVYGLVTEALQFDASNNR